VLGAWLKIYSKRVEKARSVLITGRFVEVKNAWILRVAKCALLRMAAIVLIEI
jgi:hypothetical protein